MQIKKRSGVGVDILSYCAKRYSVPLDCRAQDLTHLSRRSNLRQMDRNELGKGGKTCDCANLGLN